jgi:VWA domain-containing protein
MLALAFASPWAALVGLAAAVPLAALVLAVRRSERVAAVLGLEPAAGRSLAAGGAIAVLGVLLAVAAAQPVAESEAARFVRLDAEAWFVVDTSRSMLASTAPTEATRFDRAREVAVNLRARLGDVPVGIASLTDRVLPNLFPSASQSAFAATMLRALAIDQPPPVEQSASRSTSLAGLTALAQTRFFSPTARRRLVVVLTDGETRPFDVAAAARNFPRSRYRVLAVRFWAPGERVFRADGAAESYVPDSASTAPSARLAEATGGAMFEETQLDAVAADARQFLGRGPRRRVGTERRPVSLAPWLLGMGIVPLGLLLWRRPL